LAKTKEIHTLQGFIQMSFIKFQQKSFIFPKKNKEKKRGLPSSLFSTRIILE